METPSTNVILNDQTVTGAPAPTAPASAETAAQAAARVRDANGRFAPTTGTAPDTPPVIGTPTPVAPTPKFSPELNNLAREAFYTDEEINSFPSAALLYDAVQGRKASMAVYRQNQQPPQGGNGQAQQPQAPVQQPPAQPIALPDFALKLDEDRHADYAEPLKEVAAYVNQLKGTLVREVSQLRDENAQMKAALQQSAVASNQAVQQQHVQYFDQIASGVPGLVEAMGKPSQNLAPSSPRYADWQEIAPLAVARAQAQNVPEQFVDWQRAFGEAWTAYRAFKGNGTNGQNNGNAGLPGVAPRSAPRHTAAPGSNRDMTREEDYAYRLGRIEAMFAANGGLNPLLS
jgi:hypothetical protein